jgi:hypothetical protein
MKSSSRGDGWMAEKGLKAVVGREHRAIRLA